MFKSLSSFSTLCFSEFVRMVSRWKGFYGVRNTRKWDSELLPAGQSRQSIRLLQEKPCWACVLIYKNWKLDFVGEIL